MQFTGQQKQGYPASSGPTDFTMIPITLVSRWAGILGSCLLAATGGRLTYDVFARYFLVKPTIWAAELSQLFLIWGCLLSKRRHITVNAATKLLPCRFQKICAATSLVAMIVFSAIVAIWGWEIFCDSWQRGRTRGSIPDLPGWIAELPVPVGIVLLMAQAAAGLFAPTESHDTSLGSSQE